MALRQYLQKGGFMWADDFWGEYAWRHWERELRKVLPASEYPIIDVPMNHSIFHSLFDAKRFPQIPSIGWVYSGTTSERGPDSATRTCARRRRSEGAHHRLHLAQHRFRRLVRARVGRPDLLLQFFGGRLRDRHQHPAIRDDALIVATLFVNNSSQISQHQQEPVHLVGQVILFVLLPRLIAIRNGDIGVSICKTSTFMAVPLFVHAPRVLLSQLPAVLRWADRVAHRQLDFDDGHELARLPADRFGDAARRCRVCRTISGLRPRAFCGRVSRSMGPSSRAGRDADLSRCCSRSRWPI